MCRFHSFANCLVNLQFYTIYSCVAVLFLSFYAEETGAEESTPFMSCLGCHFSCNVSPDYGTVSSFFIFFITWLDIFVFMLHTTFILMQYALYIICKSDNLHDVSIIHEFAQLRDAFYCYVIFMHRKESIKTVHSLWQTKSSLHTFFPVHHCLLAKHFKNCVICSFSVVTLSRSHFLLVIASCPCLLLQLLLALLL